MALPFLFHDDTILPYGLSCAASKCSRPVTKWGSKKKFVKPGCFGSGLMPPNALYNQAPISPNMIWFIEISDFASTGQFSNNVVAPFTIHHPHDGKVSPDASL